MVGTAGDRRLQMIKDGFYCMDCFDGMTLIDDKSIDMILCDLPYGTTQCSWDVVIPFEPLWEEYKRIIKDNGAIVLFGMEPFSSYLRISNIEMFKYDWIWDKVKGTGFLNAKKQPMRNHEIVSVFYERQCKYYPQMTHGHKLKKSYRKKELQTDVYGEMKKDYVYESTDRYPRSIQSFSTDTQNSSLHSTQKPVALCEYLIKTYTDIGDLVLDNCAGSCSTGVACHNTGRRFIGFEKDKEIFEKANKRLTEHKAQINLFDIGLERK